MSPLQLHLLLEVFALCDLKDARYILDDIIKRDTRNMRELVKDGLIEYTFSPGHTIDTLVSQTKIPWKITEKGAYYVNRITSIKLPIAHKEWRIP